MDLTAGLGLSRVLLQDDGRPKSIDRDDSLGERLQVDCGCWSPRVRFAPRAEIYTFWRAAISGLPNEEGSRDNLKAPSGDDNLSAHPIIGLPGTDLTSFKRFLRLFGHAQRLQSDSTTAAPPTATLMTTTAQAEPINGKAAGRHNCNMANLPAVAMALVGEEAPNEVSLSPGRAPGQSDLIEAIMAFPSLYHSLREWHSFQDAQALFANLYMAGLVVGNRIQVYRSSGTTQWYTAVIISFDERTNSLTLIDDTVLEEHHEDPALLEMHLIDEGLVQSIIEGDATNCKPAGAGTAADTKPSKRSRRVQRSNLRHQMNIINSFSQPTASANAAPGQTSTAASASSLSSSQAANSSTKLATKTSGALNCPTLILERTASSSSVISSASLYGGIAGTLARPTPGKGSFSFASSSSSSSSTPAPGQQQAGTLERVLSPNETMPSSMQADATSSSTSEYLFGLGSIKSRRAAVGRAIRRTGCDGNEESAFGLNRNSVYVKFGGNVSGSLVAAAANGSSRGVGWAEGRSFESHRLRLEALEQLDSQQRTASWSSDAPEEGQFAAEVNSEPLGLSRCDFQASSSPEAKSISSPESKNEEQEEDEQEEGQAGVKRMKRQADNRKAAGAQIIGGEY